MLYMVTWIPSIYPSHVSIYTSTMDPSWVMIQPETQQIATWPIRLEKTLLGHVWCACVPLALGCFRVP